MRPGQLLRAALWALVAAGAGALWMRQRLALPTPPPAVSFVTELREVARLETLDVGLHKKIIFSPDVPPPASAWAAVWAWAREVLEPRQARVIVFAVAHLGLDLEALTPEAMEQDGRRLYLVLPPLDVTVELLPGETEVIGSNLDAAQTAALFEAARAAFAADVLRDPRLRARAEGAARRALTHFLATLGFEAVFVPRLPGLKPS
jgi:hypothetical protein